MDQKGMNDDKIIQEKLINLKTSIDKIEDIVGTAVNGFDYSNFDVKDKVNYDLFVTFTLNTLYWIYLRTKGVDPNKNDVKKELTRIRDYMLRAKIAHERNTIRPKIDQAVAGRFVKHGLNYSDKSDEREAKKMKYSNKS